MSQRTQPPGFFWASRVRLGHGATEPNRGVFPLRLRALRRELDAPMPKGTQDEGHILNPQRLAERRLDQFSGFTVMVAKFRKQN